MKAKKSRLIIYFCSLIIASSLFFFFCISKESPSFYKFELGRRKNIMNINIDFGIDETCQLKIDTGNSANSFSLPGRTLKKIKNKKLIGKSYWNDINGNCYVSDKYVLNTVKIGNILIKNAKCKEESIDYLLKGKYLYPDEGDAALRKYEADNHQGLMGSEIFRKHPYWFFDFPNQNLYMITDLEKFKKQKPNFFQNLVEVPIESFYPDVVICIETDLGKKKFLIDTGACVSIMNVSNSKLHNKEITLKKFQINEKDLKFNKITLFKLTAQTDCIKGILGMDFFIDRLLFFNFEKNTISFSVDKEEQLINSP